MNLPKLYLGTKNASSWALRAWLALKAAEVPFEEEMVDIRRPQRFPNLVRIGEFSPPASVPVLVTEDIVIFDSLAIMEFANDMADGKLLPTKPETRAEARALVAWQHAGLSGICRRISFESAFYPVKRRLTLEEQAECDRLFDHCERLLQRHSGPSLFGEISLPDFMLAPTVIRLAKHSADLSRFPRTAAWFDQVQSHPHLKEWMDEAVELPPIWDDAYLVPTHAPGLVA